MRFSLQHPAPQPSRIPAVERPKKTGYEKYQDPGYIPEIQAKSSVWGNKPQTARQDVPGGMAGGAVVGNSGPAKKMMSLEEVEAAMRSQNHQAAMQQRPPPPVPQAMPHPTMRDYTSPQPQQYQQPPSIPHQRVPSASQPIQYQRGPEPLPRDQPQQPSTGGRGQQAPQILQRQQAAPSQSPAPRSSQGPVQILQNPNRSQQTPSPSVPHASQPREPPTGPSDANAPVPVITHPQQLLQLSEEQRRAYLIEDAKRAKRNHKIFLLSKGNGLMTPQDKNFITRIQLQQLVTATGNINDPNPEAALTEDFYYQVYSQIRGAPRQHPTQPLGHFAQTYLFQTGGRSGGVPGRKQFLNGDNHMQRMQQQVQRAVEAAKLKPKNKQLIIEGSLGKISFSNAKTPKPLLNMKRQENDGSRPSTAKKPQADLSASDRKSILRNVEAVYQTLMRMEDHERRMPPQPQEDDASSVQKHMEWRQETQAMNEKMWHDLKVLDPIIPGSVTPHPFIAFLSYAKGKKAIPRIFRQIDQEQRVTILTIIVVHLDQLDVISRAQIQPGETQPPVAVRDEIDLFSQAVMPSLLGYVTEAPMNIVTGLTGLVLGHSNVLAVSRTKIGLGILTMLLSRAELVKEGGDVSDYDWQQWSDLYNRLFDTLETMLGGIFPGPINAGDDMYVWQFLAAVGIGASPDQQQRLVLAVKYVFDFLSSCLSTLANSRIRDRVMETVQQSKTLPAEMSSQRLGNVNLFMRAIGLDVELLG